MSLLRYLDVCLVLATAPFVLVAGLPMLGYLVGACAWMLTRLGAAFMHARALRAGDPKLKAGLHVAAMMSRVWIVALAVILARYAGSKDDGVMAAGLVLAALDVVLPRDVARDAQGPLPRGAPDPAGKAQPIMSHARHWRQGRHRPPLSATQEGSRAEDQHQAEAADRARRISRRCGGAGRHLRL